MATMETLIQQGKKDVIDVSTQGVKDTQAISTEIEQVKQGMSDMPDGLDPELSSMIESAENSARDEARRDVDEVIRNQIEKANDALQTSKSEIGSKIADNNSAKSKLDAISSKYGQAERRNATGALDANTRMGQDGLSEMEQNLSDNKSEVERLRNSI